ncbi:MAG: TolC family protein [Noviherbaspirillum sp.]
MSTRLRRALLFLASVAGLLWPGAVAAQPFRGRLMEAVLLTLQHEPNIAVANRQIALSEGQLQSARGEFDTVLDGGVAMAQTRTPLVEILQAPGRTQLDSRSTSYTLGASTRLRSGVTMTPALRVDRAHDNLNAASAPAASQLALVFTLPLQRGRGVEVNTVAERAAEQTLQSADLAFRHTVAARINRSLSAYWDYLAALRSLDIRIESERRLLLLLDDARRLARGDEIPQADVLQNEAQLASDRSLRLAAEQVLAEVRSALALAMGQAGAEPAGLALPQDDFPELQPSALGRLQSAAPGAAPAGRFDLLALQRRVSAAEILYDGVRKDPVSRLDLTVSLGYNGLVENRSALAALESLRRPASGFNASVGIIYVLPVQGNTHGGQLRQRAALLDQARIELDALLQSVRAGIAVQRASLASLASAALQLEQQQLQLRLQTQVFENERKKYRLGQSTALDLLTVETQLTSNELAVIDARRRLAQALIGYRYETGTLLNADGDIQNLTLQSLTTLPEPP